MTVAPHSFDADEFHDSAEPHASAEPASPAAVLKDIRFSYDRGTSWALDGVSLTVHAGERLCLVGPNGSGKSTLARLIAGLTAPDGGEGTLLGQRVYAAGPNADAYRAARHGIGMVFQNPEDQLVTTVLEDDVAFGPENLGLERELIGERIVDSLQAVGLANLRQSDPTRMSGGQQQRASIAGMLAMNPAMLVLDEPTAMLDESARAEVMRILDDLQARGTTIVHVTHHPDETVHADRIVHMEAGRIIGITAAVDNRSPLAEAVSQSETEGSIGTEAAPSRPTNDSPRQREREDGSELPLLSDGIGDMTNPIIRVSHLTYRYPSAKRAVIDDLSFTIARGETVALMGVNGSGKSTLVRMLCALTAPTAGSIEVAGVPVASTGKRGRNVRPKSANRKQLAQLRRHVGYVMQHPEHQLFADTVAEDVAYGPRNQGLGETEVADRVRESLELLHIGHLADRSPFDLSGGQQRLAAIAGVLACNPDVLIMDEPGNDLDTDMLSVMEDLLDTWPGTLIVVSHDRYLLERVTDQQFALIGGKVRHLPGGVQDYLDMVEAIKNGKGLPADTPGFAGTGSSSAKSGKGKAAAVNAAASLPQSASRIAPSSEGANNGEDSTSKLTGKAFHEASKRVNAIERKLAKLEEQKADLEAQMAAHDPSDYEGLNKLNEQLTAVNTESDDLEAEWLELSEQLE